MEDIQGSDMQNLILSALRQTGEGIALVDLSGNIIYVNRAFAESHGYTEEELMGMNLSVFHRAQDMPLVNRANRQVLEEGTFTGEIPHLHRNGRVFPTLMQSSLVRDGRGRPIGIVGTLREITEMKKGIQELEETKQLLQSVLDAIPDVIGIQDSHHTVLRYNEAGYRLLGVTPDGIEGRRCFELIGHTSPCEICATSETYRTKKPARVEKFVSELGKWLDVRAYPILDENGEIVRVIEHLRDITDIREAAEQQRKLEEQVRITQKLESLGVMAGGIAHDFNNILMAILGNADLAFREDDLPPEVLDYINEIVLAAKRAAELARLMLDYSGRSEPNKVPLSLNHLIEDTGKMLSVSVSKKAELRFDLAPELPFVLGDAAQLRQVVMNLITNASDALEDRTGMVTLSTGITRFPSDDRPRFYLNDGVRQGDFVVLTVSDTGSGMDEKTLARIFDPFFTTKFTGRGLGLAAVLGIVRAHSGGISVDSSPGEGTEISIFLPACSAREVEEAPGSPLASQTGTGRILVVDDEDSVRMVTGKILKKLGYEVTFAVDGREALDIIRREGGAFSCIILDLTMPVMDGFEAFGKIMEEDPEARIVISSGFARDVVIRKFSGRRFAGILHKPYSIDEVSAAVKKAVRRTDGHQSS